MAAATKPAAVADAPETPVVPEAPVAETPVAAVEAVVLRDFKVAQDFAAHVKTQLLSFKAGDTVEGHIGEPLYATGAPLTPIP
jgi:nucleoid-associated protein YgaU